MKKLYDAKDLQEAHLVLGLLAEAGIAAQLFNEHAQGAMGEIPFGQAYPEIWLEEERDLSRAKDVIRDYETAPPSHDTVFCPKCKEENPANFDRCWQCGKLFE